jgi:hypothetical protein
MYQIEKHRIQVAMKNLWLVSPNVIFVNSNETIFIPSSI